MCTAGQLRHPNSFELLRKRTQIWTISRIVWRALQQYQCPGNHPHDSIAGSCHPRGSSRISVSKYSELYTALFSKRVCKAIWCSNMVLEQTFRSHDEFIGAADDIQAEMPDAKRRRLNGKLHPDQLFVRPNADESSSSSGSQETQEDPLGEIRRLLQLADQCAPRVGNAIIRDGPLFEGVQNLYPEKQVVVLDVCRGINRLRKCPIGSKGIAPFRRAFGQEDLICNHSLTTSGNHGKLSLIDNRSELAHLHGFWSQCLHRTSELLRKILHPPTRKPKMKKLKRDLSYTQVTTPK